MEVARQLDLDVGELLRGHRVAQRAHHGPHVADGDVLADPFTLGHPAEELGGAPIAAGATLGEEVMRLTNGEGMPVVMEATGSVDAMQSTPDLVAAGGRIVIIGLVKKGVPVTFPGLDFTRKEMTIVGSRASVCSAWSTRSLSIVLR